MSLYKKAVLWQEYRTL